jgi:hypothetical protein
MGIISEFALGLQRKTGLVGSRAATAAARRRGAVVRPARLCAGAVVRPARLCAGCSGRHRVAPLANSSACIWARRATHTPTQRRLAARCVRAGGGWRPVLPRHSHIASSAAGAYARAVPTPAMQQVVKGHGSLGEPSRDCPLDCTWPLRRDAGPAAKNRARHSLAPPSSSRRPRRGLSVSRGSSAAARSRHARVRRRLRAAAMAAPAPAPAPMNPATTCGGACECTWEDLYHNRNEECSLINGGARASCKMAQKRPRPPRLTVHRR